jgi:glycosyltransferase involved in cell wall biosynthesis
MPFECLILGDGNHRPYCERLCARLHLADRVQFRGFVPANELQKFYADASVFVVPSVWPEPFGMVGPEAMRYGLPVVAFDSGGIKEWLFHGENGFLAPRMDTRAFASHIENLLRNKELGRQLGCNGRDRVNRVYPSSRQVDTLEQIFTDAASGSKKPPHKIPKAEYDVSSPDFSASPASSSVEALTHSTPANA